MYDVVVSLFNFLLSSGKREYLLKYKNNDCVESESTQGHECSIELV